MSNLIRRRPDWFARLVAGLSFVVVLFVAAFLLSGGLPAQQEQGKKPRVVEEQDDQQPKKQAPVEEVDEKASKRKRKVIRVDDDDTPKGPTRKTTASDSFTGNLKEMWKNAKHADLKALVGNLVRPHDIIHCERAGNRKRDETVEPVATYYGPKDELKRDLAVVPLDQNWKPEKEIHLAATVVKGITPYEEIAQKLVDAFLAENWDGKAKGSGSYLSRRDMLQAAYRILSEVGTWHSAARSRDIRQGDGWNAVEKKLQDKILEVREKQLDEFLEANDWDLASNLAREIGRSYADNNTVQEHIAARLAKYIKDAIPKGELTADRLREVRERLRQIETQFPSSRATSVIGTDLKNTAERLFNSGLDLIDAKRNQQGLEKLKQAMDLYPQLPGLRTRYLQAMNAYPILRVGVRSLPIYMAPGAACTESEQQAVEMLFEGLIRQSPVYPGTQDVAEHYEPALALHMPRLTDQLVYRFRLVPQTYWDRPLDPEKEGADTGPKPLSNSDVQSTWQLMKNRNSPWSALIQNVLPGNDDREVRVTFRHGFIDPWTAMTFKVLPDDAGKENYKEEFARKPFGSGPYRVEGRPKTINDLQTQVFMANPYYAARPGKQDLPRIREVHFALPQKPSEDLKNGKLDLLLPDAFRDLDAAEREALSKVENVKIIGPKPTRRIYFLAVNMRKPVFQSEEVRQAFAYAIQRSEILATVFGGQKGNEPLNGPYPRGSWACDPKVPPLDKEALAKAQLQKGDTKAKLTNVQRLKLKYPRDDKTAVQAMEMVARQLEQTLPVKIELDPRDPHELRDQVEDAPAYDLAYFHYDFPSEAYWLWPVFDPKGGYLRGVNVPGISVLESLMVNAMTRRDPAELKKLTHDIHNWVKDRMFIIPLWQLGSYYAIRDGFETPEIDPLRVLAEVDRWQPKTR
jgi:peptide/nickel transport system substrate-binding protein